MLALFSTHHLFPPRLIKQTNLEPKTGNLFFYTPIVQRTFLEKVCVVCLFALEVALYGYLISRVPSSFWSSHKVLAGVVSTVVGIGFIATLLMANWYYRRTKNTLCTKAHNDWTQQPDPSTGRDYWFNHFTQESSWHPPYPTWTL